MTDFQLKLKNLPTSSGVYLFKDKQAKIIYIGKAKNLKNRVRTYFQSPSRHDPKTLRLVAKVTDFELMVTDSEVEALILEANLIKEHKPRYNVDLRDDKHFPYIKITNEPFPQVLIVRKVEKDNARYFGPFTSSKGMRRTVQFLTRLFRIRTCRFMIPHPDGKKYQVCLDYRIDRCGGPCEGFQSQEEYAELVNSVILVLSGKSKELIKRLAEKMKFASDNMEYEEACKIRDQIEAIESVMIKQKVDVGEIVDRDMIAFAREEKYVVAVILQIREGILIGRQDFQINADTDDTDDEILHTFLSQYYNHQPNMPKEIYLPLEVTDKKLYEQWFKESKTHLITPKIGQKVKLVDLAAKNARLLLDELLIQKQKQSERTSKMVTALQSDLGLNSSPKTVVCFDISNTGETDAVGSCVYFENGKPKKSQYRHFKIKGVTGQDDYKMMREIIGRYFFRIKEESTTPPDLLVVDGGKGQLSSAKTELEHLGFHDQTVIGLAKRLEEVFLPGRSDPLIISKASPGLILLKLVRDEAHRFAIEYNRKVRSKRTIKSALDDIKGIGPARRKMLLKKYKSVAKIKELSVEELSQEKGITEKLAEMILKGLK